MQGAEARQGLTCWLLDTRSIWPGQKIADSESAREALALISEQEQETILRKYHIADARVSLGSALLKRLFVHKSLGTKWQDIKFGRLRDPTHGKPYALLRPNSNEPAPLEFNVSHQAGVVALVGCKTSELDTDLGVDIVCVNERSEYRVIDAEGFDGWIDIYSEIFSREESSDMKYKVNEFSLPDGTVITPGPLGEQARCPKRNQNLSILLPDGSRKIFRSDSLIDAKLRRFYTYWCFKEAYIKLDGEALLAKWIPQLEFKNVRAPKPDPSATASTGGVWGERVSDAEVWWTGAGSGPGRASEDGSRFGGTKRLEDIRLEIQAFEEKFMIGVAAKEKSGNALPQVLTSFTSLQLEGDVMAVARQA